VDIPRQIGSATGQDTRARHELIVLLRTLTASTLARAERPAS